MNSIRLRSCLLAVPVCTFLGWQAGCKPKSQAPASAAVPVVAGSVPLAGIQEGLKSFIVEAPESLQVWFPAEAAGDESAQSTISAPVSGLIANAPAAPGRPIAAGAPLLILQSPELAEIKSRLLSAQARLRRAGADLAREQRLTTAQAGARRDLEMAEAEFDSAKAEAESAGIALRARGVDSDQTDGMLVLRAPTAGVVASWKVRLGQGVVMHQELGSFQAASASLALLEMPPPMPTEWKLGSRTKVRDDKHSWLGEVVGLPSSMGDMTHRLTFRLRLSGGPLPLPGTPLEVQVPVGRGVLVPGSALQQIEGEWGVFVQEGESARFNPVKKGPDSGRKTLILEGVPPGAKIIGEGAYLLKSKLMRIRMGAGDE